MKKFLFLAILLTACANAPAYTPLAPVSTYGSVANSTFVAAQVTNANATAQAFAATGAVYSAQEAQATQNARSTQEAIDAQLTLDANQRLNDSATSTAQAITTATARAEARETATAQTQATATAQAHIAATSTGQALATSQKLKVDQQQQDLAEQALWINALTATLNNGVLVCTIAFVILAIAGMLFGLAWMYLALRRKWLQDKQLEIAGMGGGTYRRLVGNSWEVEHLPAPPIVIDSAPPALEPDNPHAHAQAWRIAILRFLIAGNRFGFGIRDLGSEGQSVISNDGWRELTRLLKDHRILQDGRIQGRRGTFTIWGDGWTLQKFKAEQHQLDLPFPESDPPAVQIVPHSTTAQHSTTLLAEGVE